MNGYKSLSLLKVRTLGPYIGEVKIALDYFAMGVGELAGTDAL